MNLLKPELNYVGPVEFQCLINFNEMEYKDSDLGWFHHYYEGIFKDGTKTYFYHEKDFYDEEEEGGIDYCTNLIWVDIKKPYVASNHPQLIEYTFMDSEHSLYSQKCFIQDSSEPLNEELETKHEIKSDYIINFEVLYSDPNGFEPFEEYTRLIFKNMEFEKELEITMRPNHVISSFSQYYCEIFRSYICRVNCSKLFAGVWSFYFEAKDSKGYMIKNLIGEEKFTCT